MRFTRWDQKLDYGQSIISLREIQKFIEIQNPGIRERVPDFPWDTVVSMLDFIPPYEELTTVDARTIRQVMGLYQKFEPLETGIDKEKVAYDKFMEAEASCMHTNIIFEGVSKGQWYHPSDVDTVLDRARRKIASILGDVPKLSELRLQFGPGATTQVKKKEASITKKFSVPFACSEPTSKYLSEVLYELPHLLSFDGDEGVVSVDIVPGRLQFVPKTAKTYRAIVVEPYLTGMCQSGIQDYMQRRLRAAGIDIQDQSLNQRLARLGSLTGELATLDLSSASDTVSTALVYSLLPFDWAWFLSKYRSSHVEYNGSTIRLEKFSSMGNGITFPLETIIFYALTWASCPRGATVNAYGDDIICPSANYVSVVRTLEYCGFTVNKAKSFSSGSFRESCGADYLKGIDIRPFYFKELISCADIFCMHNFMKEAGNDDLADFLAEWFLDESVRIYGPPGFGDGHLIGPWVGKPIHREDGWAGHTFETYTNKPRLEMKLLPGDHVLPSYSIYARYRDINLDDDYVLPRRPAWDRDLGPTSNNLKYVKLTGLNDYGVVKPEPLTVKNGAPRCSLPGTLKGYKRIKIYTLVSPDYI